ncbi:MAG: dolichyl-phosphate mannose synthase [Marmoricola sp.]|nr:dolichyl-phosphate mannose synthase [Marmoricola sp.]
MPREPHDRRRVLVIIPAWNEEGSVAETVLEVRATNPDVDVVVVDDGSTDRTAARAREAGAQVCQLPFNLGVGGAMRAGYRYAVRHDYDVAVQIDADGQHDSRFLPTLLERLEGGPDGADPADVVIGARFASEDDTYQAGGLRRLAMRMLAWVLSRMAHTRLTDVTSGFRLANRRALVLFAQHYPAEYLGDTVESLVIALRGGLVVRQEPVQMRERQAGVASQSSFKAAIYLGRACVALALALVRRWPEQTSEGHR